MNIKEAKDQIKNAMTAYFTKDEFGNYVIPIEKQRPVFLMGPPGIGKTAVMEQIAAEMGVGLLSYSMTHHTRQSALGLPFIVHKSYGGKEYDVSEYTMSEIISSIYELMENSGVKEGILFLDEINCVSETLSPIMLQFLQYKVFGRHRVPDGWIVVTAGNPPEYNNSVREYDIVTWDRLKRIDIEPDFNAWKEYAYKFRVHPSVITYLEIKKNDFYFVESTVGGKSFVTARGWDDLSQMIILYEKHGIKVDEKLIVQYLQNKKTAKNFAAYYDLFNRYKSDYQVDSILGGKASDEIKDRAKNAKFDERLSLLGLMLDAIGSYVRERIETDNMLLEMLNELKKFKQELALSGGSPKEAMDIIINRKNKEITASRSAGNLSHTAQIQTAKLVTILEDMSNKISDETDTNKAFKTIKADYDKQVKAQKKECELTKVKLTNLFKFCEEVFSEGQELLILVTELTANYYSAMFIGKYGCDEYFKNNKNLLFYERQREITAKIEKLDLD